MIAKLRDEATFDLHHETSTLLKQAADMLEAEENKAADTKRINWLNNNIFNRENLDMFGKVDQKYNMWVMFSPKGASGNARTIIDAAMVA